MISFSLAYLCVNSCSRRSVTQFQCTASAPTIRLIPFTFAAFLWCSKSLVFTQGFSAALQSQHFCASQYYTAVKNVSSQTHISFPFLKSLWIRGGIPTTHNILSPGTFVYERQINNLSPRSLLRTPFLWFYLKWWIGWWFFISVLCHVIGLKWSCSRVSI